MSIKKGVKSDWDEEIADAREKLAQGKAYVRRLRDALRIFERNKANNIPRIKGGLRTEAQQHSV